MATEVERPDLPNLQECLEYLDFLRETGVTNMFGAAPYLAEGLDLDPKMARKVLAYWMQTFSERHPKEA